MRRGDTVTISANEVLRATEWILRGRGIDCGNEDAPARAATWLVLRYPPALQGLLSELAEPGALAPLEGLQPRPSGRGIEIDAAGASALLVCPLALDWLRARAWPSDAKVAIRNLASPLWCLGHLDMLDAAPGLVLSARAGDGASVLSASRATDGQIEVALMAPVEATWGVAYDSELQAAAPGPAHADAIERLSGQRLADAARTAMSEGLCVPVSLWHALSRLAYQAFVPGSEASRERGAGGGDDNQ